MGWIGAHVAQLERELAKYVENHAEADAAKKLAELCASPARFPPDNRRFLDGYDDSYIGATNRSSRETARRLRRLAPNKCMVAKFTEQWGASLGRVPGSRHFPAG